MTFTLLATDGAARRGRLETAHGIVETPVFMPVGTQGSVKSLAPDELSALGASIILGNTYHLFLRPGHERIGRLGGLHRFMGWEGAILTDSGGFQVMSLGAIRTIAEDGVTFRSHLDGSRCFLSPEDATRIQMALGSDIAMCFDECTKYPATREYAGGSARRSARWARRCRAVHEHPSQALFGIVQGGVYPELRVENARELVEAGFDGYAVGSLAVGEPKSLMHEVIEAVAPELPKDRPRYLMGVGTPADLVEGVARGIDMFDCVMPTRNARNGTLFTSTGATLQIKNARFAEDSRPIEEGCGCFTCRRFSRAYLRHLHMAKELLSYRLNTLHNLCVYLRLMERMRASIASGGFSAFRRDFLARAGAGAETAQDD